MSFRGHLRPGQGFKPFIVYSRVSSRTASGRVTSGDLERQGVFLGMITQASAKDIEQHKQLGHPITHTIVQRGTANRAKATDVLELEFETKGPNEKPRRFLVQTHPKDPGELGHFLVYHVEERDDL